MHFLMQAALVGCLFLTARSAAAAIFLQRDDSTPNEVPCPDDPGGDQNGGCFCPVTGTMMCPGDARSFGDFSDASDSTCPSTKRGTGSDLLAAAGIPTRPLEPRVTGVNYPFSILYDPPDQSKEKILSSTNPMQGALYTLSLDVVQNTADRVVFNGFPQWQENSVITGVSGVLQDTRQFSIGRDTDRSFDKGTRWEIRFDTDLAALPNVNTATNTFQKGTHVNLEISGTDVGIKSTLKAAFSATAFDWLPNNQQTCSSLTGADLAKDVYQRVVVSLSKQVGYWAMRKALAVLQNPANTNQYIYYLSPEGRGAFSRNGVAPVSLSAILASQQRMTTQDFAVEVANQLVAWYGNF